MTTSDSGVIDLFAIHKEEEARKLSVPPSAPPPPVAFDVQDRGYDRAESYGDIEGYAAAQQRARRKTKILGGIVGAVAVVGVVIGAIALGSAKEAPNVAAEPAPLAVAAPPPAAEPVPAPAQPAPPPPATAKTEKPDYTPATAAAAYAASQGKKKAGPFRVGRPIGGGVKMQKIQSSGVSN